MSNPLIVLDSSKTENRELQRKKAEVFQLYSATEKLFGNLVGSPSTLALGHFSQNLNQRDSRAIDYLVIGVLSLMIHSVAVDFLKRLPIEQEELIEAVKIPSKVQISFVQPKPKPIVTPPPAVKPPPPKVVALEKPPTPKIKPKPELKTVEHPPILTPVSDAAPEAPVIATPAPPKPVEKVTQPSSGADYLNNPTPAYPDVAMDRGWEGNVLMKVHVLANGRPDSVSVIKSSGHDLLDDEAVRTVKKWSFVPGKRGDTPIDGWVTVPITFNLQN